MRRRAHSTRSSRSRPRRAAAAPVLTALLLAFAMLAQAGLATLHSLFHTTGHGPDAATWAASPHGPPAGQPAAAHHAAAVISTGHQPQGTDHQPFPAPAHRHGPNPGSCDLCALIAIGKLGWSVPAPIQIVGSTPVSCNRVDVPPSRTLSPSLITAAPRGPPLGA